MHREFGKLKDGQTAMLYTLENSGGMRAEVSNYGATLVSLLCLDMAGCERDIVLGYDDASGYERGGCYFGATIGRYANRIGGASFELGDRVYELSANDRGNSLHGGRDCYAHRIWDLISETDRRVCFGLLSPDMDQGFPGELDIRVSYTITDDDEIYIDYMAESRVGIETPINLTNHSYFNLNGHDSGSAVNHKVQINADSFTEIGEDSVTTGRLINARSTEMDFREMKIVSRDIDSDYYQIAIGGGYDHNYVIADDAGMLREAAVMYSEESGIRMRVLSDMPGMQFYSGNYINDERGKSGAVYDKRSGLCFETQNWPDAVNKPEFPQTTVKPGGIFKARTIYAFDRA